MRVLAELHFVWVMGACLGVAVLPAHSDEIRIPAELVQQLFDQQTPNRAIPKRPFDLAELTAVVRTYGRTTEVAADLTRRYLQISHAAGLVELASIGSSELPEAAKRELFRATPGSVQFKLAGEPLKRLDQFSPEQWQELADLTANLAADQASLEIAALLKINQERYSGAIFYVTQVPIHTDAAYYLVSYPRRATHLLDAFLELGRGQQRQVVFSNANCVADICRSQGVGDSFASFRFLGSDAAYPKAGQQVEARCRYQVGYRREYEARIEMEFAFEECTLEKLDGLPPRRDPLLDQLHRVTLP